MNVKNIEELTTLIETLFNKGIKLWFIIDQMNELDSSPLNRNEKISSGVKDTRRRIDQITTQHRLIWSYTGSEGDYT